MIFLLNESLLDSVSVFVREYLLKVRVVCMELSSAQSGTGLRAGYLSPVALTMLTKKIIAYGSAHDFISPSSSSQHLSLCSRLGLSNF